MTFYAMSEEKEKSALLATNSLCAKSSAEMEEKMSLFTDLNQMLDRTEKEPEALNRKPVYSAPAAQNKMGDTSAWASRERGSEESVITESVIVNGDMVTKGTLDVRGHIVGNIEVLGQLHITGGIRGNSQAAEIYMEGADINGDLRSMGNINVGRGTVIIGNVFADSAVIAGAIKGDIDVKGHVILDASAIVMGNVKSKSVQVNNGAVMEGVCSQCYADVNPAAFFDNL